MFFLLNLEQAIFQTIFYLQFKMQQLGIYSVNSKYTKTSNSKSSKNAITQQIIQMFNIGYRPTRKKMTDEINSRIRKQNISIFKILAIMILVSIIIYISSFPIRYLQANSDSNRKVENCIQSQVVFNGWDYFWKCSKCSEGFQLQSAFSNCKQKN